MNEQILELETEVTDSGSNAGRKAVFEQPMTRSSVSLPAAYLLALRQLSESEGGFYEASAGMRRAIELAMEYDESFRAMVEASQKRLNSYIDAQPLLPDGTPMREATAYKAMTKKHNRHGRG